MHKHKELITETRHITEEQYTHYHALNNDKAKTAYVIEQLLGKMGAFIAMHYGIYNHDAIKQPDGTYILQFQRKKHISFISSN